MNRYKEIDLGQDGIDYVRNRLAYGKTLAKSLLQRVELNAGRVSTFLPLDVSEESAKQFSIGGKVPPERTAERRFMAPDGTKWRMTQKADTSDDLVAYIEAFLEPGYGRICVFEDALARASDPSMSSPSTKILVCDDEVYHFLSWEDRDHAVISRTIREAQSWLVIGVLATLPREGAFPVDNRVIGVGSEDLKLLAEKAEKIIVDAYDGEGYVIWTRSASRRI